MPTSENFQGFRQRGLCGSCGSVPAAEGRSKCVQCLERDALYRADLRRDGIQPKASNIELFLDPSIRRVGVLDIESSNLRADFAITFCVVVKVFGTDEMRTFVIDLRPTDMLASEKKMLRELLHYLRSLEGVITYYGCVTPEHQVLTDDLRWVPVGTLKPGDGLLAFDDEAQDGKRRNWKRAQVIHAEPIVRPVVELALSDGTKLTSTEDHPWLVSTASGWEWVQAKDISPGMEMTRLLPVWKADDSREAGWLAGFFDSEGSLHQYGKREDKFGTGFQVAASQNDNAVLKEAKGHMDTLGFRYGVYPYDARNEKIRSLSVRGGVPELLRFLGTVRPNRLLAKFKIDGLGSLKGIHPSAVTVESVRNYEDKVIGLGTTSGTYIVEGFGSHNTGFDVPFLRTRFLSHGLNTFTKMRNLDLYYTVKSKLLLSRNRLANVIEMLSVSDPNTPPKGRVDPALWMRAVYARDEGALDAIVKHCQEDVIALEAALLKLRGVLPDRVIRK